LASVPEVQTFATGFISVANLAHRQDGATLTNTFKVVVLSDSSDITIRKNVVHVATVQPASSTGFIEVPAGKPYFVQVFDNTVSDTTLFGTTTTSAATVPATTALTTPLTLAAVGPFFASGNLQAGEMAIFRIVTNGASVGPTTPAAVPLNGNGLFKDETRAIVWNNIETVSVKFAAPAEDCCNYGFNTRTTALGNGGVASTLLNDASAITSFDVFPGTASDKCSTLGSSTLIAQSNTLTFTRATGGSCSADGVILTGRSVNFQKTVPIAGCTTPASATISASKIVAQTSPTPLSSEPSESTNLQLRFTATFCDCAEPAPVCTSLTCEEERTLQQQVAAFATLISSSTSAVTAAVTASQNALGVVLADTNADVGNTNSTLLAAINSRTSSIPTIASDVSAVRSDIRRLRNEVGDVEDAVDDVEDAVDDVQDAVDDLQDAVDDL